MSSHLKWSFTTPRRVMLKGAARLVELCYEAAGFRSGWTVVIDGRTAARFPDLITAQEQALRLVNLSPMQKAA